jgi:hypothetical protein
VRRVQVAPSPAVHAADAPVAAAAARKAAIADA